MVLSQDFCKMVRGFEVEGLFALKGRRLLEDMDLNLEIDTCFIETIAQTAHLTTPTMS